MLEIIQIGMIRRIFRLNTSHILPDKLYDLPFLLITLYKNRIANGELHTFPSKFAQMYRYHGE